MLRHKVEIFVAIERLHFCESFGERVFPCDFVTSREMVNLLESAKVEVDVRLDYR